MTPQLARRLGQACRFGIGLALLAGYALLSHVTASSGAPSVTGALVALGPMLGLSFLIAWRAARRPLMLALWLLAGAGLYAARHWLIAHYHWVFLLEHAGTYAALCASFGRTLRNGQTPMISGFAQKVHGRLTPTLAAYTRSVTWAWTLYFGGVSGLSLLLFWLAPLPVWSAFAYLLGVPLLVLMFLVEYAVRCRVLPPAERTGLLVAIRAYRQASHEAAPPPRTP